MRRETIARAGLYAGGFLGPFGAGVLTVLIPNLRHTLHVSTAVATTAIPAYLVPFALLQIVSGTLGERFGLTSTIRVAYVVYAVASVAVAAMTTIGPFLLARALQGVANAFTTPLLLAALAESTRDRELGRAMGTFASVQTAGQVTAPLCGGLLGVLDPRLAFVVPGIVALILAVAPLPARAQRDAAPARLRAAFNRRVGWLSLAALLAFMSITGLAFLVSLRAADAFGVGTTTRGLLLAGFGLSGVLAGRAAGGLVDRGDPGAIARVGALACACVLPLLGLVGSAVLVAVVWFAAGLGSAVLWAGLNTLAVRSAPGNRAGAVSVIGAFKFTGAALAPLVWLPLYDARAWIAFAAAGVAAAAIVPALGRLRAVPLAAPGTKADAV
jgi:MFS family permease